MSEDDMNMMRPIVPRREETQGTESLTKVQKVIGVCLLLFYLAMIGVTIATWKFTVSSPDTFKIPLNFN
jgi:hypothetical protein